MVHTAVVSVVAWLIMSWQCGTDLLMLVMRVMIFVTNKAKNGLVHEVI